MVDFDDRTRALIEKDARQRLVGIKNPTQAQVNSAVADALAPYRAQMDQELAELKAQHAAELENARRKRDEELWRRNPLAVGIRD